MRRAAIDNARPWFEQAASDARTARALLATPVPMRADDVGCHVAALSAQALEKSIKGYVFLNGNPPAMSHRPEPYLFELLGGVGLTYTNHQPVLSRLFDRSTRASIESLLDLTPGSQGSVFTVPNTEYPWQDQGKNWRFTPVGSDVFGNASLVEASLKLAKRVSDELHKLWYSANQASAP